ncbi:hypothetical protein QBC43DRAFT_36615 [Cladorrhinum sp. PSN259]|nr:hypothetical protein QBC43DRAFT_36615 [Cladorrhinum sp. PSN259]
MSSQNDMAATGAGDNNHGLYHPQIRSTSSSYPSVGIRSPDLTVSPPMTFDRRIFSSLSGYGFSREHLSFLESDDDDIKDRPNTPAPEAAIEDSKPAELHKAFESSHKATSTQMSQDIPLYPGEENLFSAEAAIVAAIPQLTISRPNTCPPQVDRSHLLQSTISSSSGTEDEMMEDINLSTQCLPRLSTNLSFSHSGRPSLDQSHRLSFSASLKSRISGHFRRHHSRPNSQSVVRHQPACCQKYKPVRVVKVKKWFVRQFRAGRKGSRVIVMKVRMIHHSGAGTQGKDKVIGKKQRNNKSSTVSKIVRTRLMGVFSDGKGKDKGKQKVKGGGMPC